MAKKRWQWRVENSLDIERIIFGSLCGIGLGIILTPSIDLNRIAERLIIVAGCVETVRSMMIPAVKTEYDDGDDDEVT